MPSNLITVSEIAVALVIVGVGIYFYNQYIQETIAAMTVKNFTTQTYTKATPMMVVGPEIHGETLYALNAGSSLRALNSTNAVNAEYSLYAKNAANAVNAESASYAESTLYLCPVGAKPASGLCSLASAYGLTSPLASWYTGEWVIAPNVSLAGSGDRGILFSAFTLNTVSTNVNAASLLTSSSNGAYALINFPIKGQWQVSWRVRPGSGVSGGFAPYFVVCNGRGSVANAPITTNIGNMAMRLGETDATSVNEATCFFTGVCNAGDSMYVALYSQNNTTLTPNNGTTLRVSLQHAFF